MFHNIGKFDITTPVVYPLYIISSFRNKVHIANLLLYFLELFITISASFKLFYFFYIEGIQDARG